MEDILTGLNSAQKTAVINEEGSLIVLAGAGSGKTKVLTHRIAFLVSKGVKPWQILAVTFTNKAANEMKQRLEFLLGEASAKQVWVGTFHSICGKFLRYEIENYKVNGEIIRHSNFVIFDENDSISLIKQAVKQENLDDKLYQPKNIKATISESKNKMIDAQRFSATTNDYRNQNVAKVYEIYENLLKSNNALDFDDLLLLTVKMFENCPEVLDKYKSRFGHIMVDEFQDTNLPQYRMISLLYKGLFPDYHCEETEAGQEIYPHKRSLCVVGDIDQSIYSWRGADYKILLNLQNEYPDAELIKLEQNYRSTENILKAANAIIVNNKERISKNLYSNKGSGEKIILNETNDESEEAHFISEKILELSNNSKYGFNDFVVLYRTNAQSRSIEEAFMSRKIPYTMVGGMKFYERKEIKDIIAYLKLIYNTSDSQSLKRIINVPKRSIGSATINKIEELARREYMSMFSVLERIQDYEDISPKVAKKLKEFTDLILNSREKSKHHELSEFISLLIEDTGYIGELQAEGTEEANSRIENIREFISVAREQEEIGLDNELGEFLTRMSLLSDLDSIVNTNEAVTLMTLHSAKGLEFPIVFMAGLEEGLFPHSRTLGKNLEMEEERRLMYVGVTRAEDLLFLTFAKRRLIYGDYRYFVPSRFIDEIPSNLISSVSSKHSEKKSSIYKDISSQNRRTYFSKKDEPIGTTNFGKDFKLPASLNKEKSSLSTTKKITQTIQPENIAHTNPDSTRKKMHEIFREDTKVIHEKFGEGKIEKILKVGENHMYSVHFPSIGKRLIAAGLGVLKKV